jgi:WD40 repeat protein
VDDTVTLWSSSGHRYAQLKQPLGKRCNLDFSPDGKLLAATTRSGSFVVWDVATKRQLYETGETSGRFAFSADSSLLATNGSKLSLWDAATGRLVRALPPIEYAEVLAFAPDGKRLAAGTLVRTVVIVDAQTGQVERTMEGHRETVDDLEFSPDGSQLVSSSADKTLRIWDMRTFETQEVLEGHEGPLSGVDLFADGAKLVSVGVDSTLRVWSIDRAPRVARLTGHVGRAWGVEFSPDGELVAAPGAEGQVRIWKVATRRPYRVFDTGDQESTELDFSANGKQLLTVGPIPETEEIGVLQWDLESGSLLRALEMDTRPFSAVFSPDGKTFAATGGGVTDVWDAKTGDLLRVLEKDGSRQVAANYSPDGRWLATAGADKTVRIWDVGTGERLKTLRGYEHLPYHFQFSKNMKRLVVGDMGGKIVVWDLTTGEKIRELVGHTRWVNEVRFVPGSDEKQLVSASDEGTVRFWNMETGENTLIIKTRNEAYSAVVSPDGKLLALTDQTDIFVYPLDLSVLEAEPRELLEQTQREAGLRLKGFALVPASSEATKRQ